MCVAISCASREPCPATGGAAQLQAAPQAAPGTALHTFSVTPDETGLTRDSGKNDREKALRTVPGGSAQGGLVAANSLALPFATAGSDSGHIQQRPAKGVGGGDPQAALQEDSGTVGPQGRNSALPDPPNSQLCFFSHLNFPVGCLPILMLSSPFPELVLLARGGRSRGSLRILLPLRVQPLGGERAHAGECPHCPPARGR